MSEDGQPAVRTDVPLVGIMADLVEALVDLGAEPEVAEAAVRRGDPESGVFQGVLLREREKRTVTPAEIEAEGGLSVQETGEVMHAFGFPPPAADEPAFTLSEAHVFIELGRLSPIWPRDLRVQLARLYGRTLARVAGAELQAFVGYSLPSLRGKGGSRAGSLTAVQAAFEQLLPLADPLLTGVHRRWIEHELAQVAVRNAEDLAGPQERLPGSVEVALLFCDIKDFTRYAEKMGDAAAIGLVDRFFDIVTNERGDAGRVVKALGDGAMLAYDSPPDAVAAGARIVGAMSDADTPGVHASVHVGQAIAREGDFFGGAVNLAARLLALAGRDQLVASQVVMERSPNYQWESIGEHPIRGVAEPMPVYRLLS
ncbi:MAG: adenylate/guanylate cyclase domain-containing protein [Candidatus Dormiibacterota bacterium]